MIEDFMPDGWVNSSRAKAARDEWGAPDFISNCNKEDFEPLCSGFDPIPAGVTGDAILDWYPVDGAGKCPHCGRPFRVSRINQLYCSQDCKREHYRERKRVAVNKAKNETVTFKKATDMPPIKKNNKERKSR